jgi:hypothetical protein
MRVGLMGARTARIDNFFAQLMSQLYLVRGRERVRPRDAVEGKKRRRFVCCCYFVAMEKDADETRDNEEEPLFDKICRIILIVSTNKELYQIASRSNLYIKLRDDTPSPTDGTQGRGIFFLKIWDADHTLTTEKAVIIVKQTRFYVRTVVVCQRGGCRHHVFCFWLRRRSGKSITRQTKAPATH